MQPTPRTSGKGSARAVETQLRIPPAISEDRARRSAQAIRDSDPLMPLGRTAWPFVTVDNAPREASTLREMFSAAVDQGERELVASLRQGDEPAFVALVQKCHPSMVRL